MTRFTLSLATRQAQVSLHHMMRTIRPWTVCPPGLLVLMVLTVGVLGAGCTGTGGASADSRGSLVSSGVPTPGQSRTEHAHSTEIPVAQSAPSPTPSESKVTVTSTPIVAASPLVSEPQPTGHGPFKLPMRVRIPRIKVDAAIETVGLAPNGEMSPPRRHEDVAWYGYSPSPGSPGASVLAGHVDSVHGPAVFWSLRDLRPGDNIEVDLVGGTTQRFVVEGSGWYTPEEAPLRTIFTWDGPPRLHLITCGGVFDRGRRTYSQRLVVYARLDPSAPAQDSAMGAFSSENSTHVPPFAVAH